MYGETDGLSVNVVLRSGGRAHSSLQVASKGMEDTTTLRGTMVVMQGPQSFGRSQRDRETRATLVKRGLDKGTSE